MNINFDMVKISPRMHDAPDYRTLVFKVDFPRKIDIENSDDFWLFFKALADGGALNLLVNMERAEYIDSSGISVLINTTKLLRKAGGDLVVTTVSQEIKKIFSIVYLQDFIKFFHSEIEGINHFRHG